MLALSLHLSVGALALSSTGALGQAITDVGCPSDTARICAIVYGFKDWWILASEGNKLVSKIVDLTPDDDYITESPTGVRYEAIDPEGCRGKIFSIDYLKDGEPDQDDETAAVLFGVRFLGTIDANLEFHANPNPSSEVCDF